MGTDLTACNLVVDNHVYYLSAQDSREGMDSVIEVLVLGKRCSLSDLDVGIQSPGPDFN